MSLPQEENDFHCDVALKGVAQMDAEYEDDQVLTSHHTNPFCPVHIGVIPKAHPSSLIDLCEFDQSALHSVLTAVQAIAQK